MKIRIFALAKELGMESKELIDLCASAGIHAKNSALAGISPEERDVVLALIKKGSGARKPAAEPAAPVPLRNDVPEVAGKLRDIRQISQRPQPTRGPGRAAQHEAGAESSVAVAELPPTEIPIEQQPVDELPAESAPSIAAEAAPAAPETETHPAPQSAPAERKSDADEPGASAPEPVSGGAAPGGSAPAVAAAGSSESEPSKPTAPGRGPANSPLSRGDYISASGGIHRRPVRYDMAPRGSVAANTEGDSRGGSKPKDRAKGMPAIAQPPKMEMPQKKPVKTEEGPAQKPVVRLTPEMMQSPLGGQLKGRDDRKVIRDVNKVGKSGRTIEEDLLELAGQGKKGVKAGPLAPDKGKKGADAGRRRGGTKLVEDEAEGGGRKRLAPRRPKHKGAVALKTSAEIELPITVRTLSEAIGRPAKDLLKLLFQRGQMITINDVLAEDVALELALELGVDLTVHHERDVEAELAAQFDTDEDSGESVVRPPIITILGHVDHGKTTLLDKIRRTNVAAGEAGGITQHIAAYQVEHNGQKLTFVDTPGHAAFGEMRARGANVTDIIVLVVAADDGVMPQTEECISHAKAAGVPIVVALNKIDLPAANPQRVLQQLAAHEILPTEWGGEVEVVRTSGATGEGLDTLLETLLLTAEIHELKANPDQPAIGVCLESFRDEGRGSLAWLIVQKGTLRVGDVVLCGQSYGRIRAMYDDLDREIQEAGPSTPLKVAGLDRVPNAGDHFFALEDLEEARQIAEDRRQKGRADVLAGRRQRPRTLDDILTAARGGAVQDLPLILKVDTPGSLEALRHEIGKIDHPEVRVQIIHEAIGGVNESDVALANAGGAIIIAFHVIPEDGAAIAADRDGVEIRRYDIIYEVTDHIKRALEGLLIPEKRQVNTGRALVLQTFHISRIGTVAGCRVLSGTIERSNRIQVIRDQKILNEYAIASLKREKDDAKEVREGFECGIRLDGFNDVKEGDLLQAYRVEEVKRTLE